MLPRPQRINSSCFGCSLLVIAGALFSGRRPGVAREALATRVSGLISRNGCEDEFPF